MHWQVSLSSKKAKLLESAQKFILKGQLDRAIKDYEQVLAVDPGDIRQRQRLAELLVRINRKDDAVAEYETIGKHYADNLFYLKAIAVYKQIQKLNPQDFKVSLNLARLNEKQGLMGNALAEYSRVYGYYENSGKRADALSILESMLSLDPDNLNTRLKFAESRFAAGAIDKAYDEFFMLALLLHSRGDLSAWNQVCERVKHLFPQKTNFMLDLLEARFQAGDAASVLPALREITGQDPANYPAWQLLLKSLKAAGGGEPLKSALQEAARLFPDEIAPKEGLLQCALEQGDAEILSRLLKLYAPALVENGASAVLERLYLQVAERLPGQTGLFKGLEAYCGKAYQRHRQADNEAQPTPVKAAAAPAVADLGGEELSLDMDEPQLPEVMPEEIDFSAQSHDFSQPEEESVEADIELDLSVEALMDMAASDAIAGAAAGAHQEMEDVTQQPEEADFELDLPEDILMDLDLTELDIEVRGEEPRDFEMPSGEIDFSASGVEPDQFGEAEPNFLPDDILDLDVDLELEQELNFSEGDEDDDILDSVFPTARRGPDEQLDKEDTETHYNLGIAFKEMGLYDDAIAEFQAASRDPRRKLDCIILQGMCCRDKGDVARAEGVLKKGMALAAGGSPGEDPAPLQYELALLYESTGRVEEALLLYRQIKAIAPRFRDTVTRIAVLQGDATPAPYDLDGLEELDLVELED